MLTQIGGKNAINILLSQKNRLQIRNEEMQGSLTGFSLSSG
jgi:hypothetical protein